jgi:exosome complex component RRP4
VAVHAKLVKKQRYHFSTLEGLDVDIVAGLNGLIWVSPHVARGEDGTPLQQQQQQQGQGQASAAASAGGGSDAAAAGDDPQALAAAAAAAAGPSKAQREAVVRVAGAIRTLAALMLQVYPASVVEAYKVSRGAAPTCCVCVCVCSLAG